MPQATKVLILGAGFAGIHVAMKLERLFHGDRNVEITLISRDNFVLFTPMLHEVAASDLDMTAIVNPVRKMLRRAQFIASDVESINLKKKAGHRIAWPSPAQTRHRLRPFGAGSRFRYKFLWT